MSVHKEVCSTEDPCSSGNAPEQFLVTDWAQLPSVCCSTGFSSYSVGDSSIPTVEGLPSLSCFGSDSLLEIVNSFGLPESTQMASAVCAQEFTPVIENGTQKNLKGKNRRKLSECGPLQSHSPLASNQNVEAEQQRDVPTEMAKKDESKLKNEVSEDYIHVRAKRGQATNSHSLAERVRREKISERMRLLQDLVPGCNKITGKAVMLDEIINYVQSLQRQVEFLSMKLAAVNPEIHLDIEQILTKGNLHSRFGSVPAIGYCPQIATSHPQLQPGMAIPSLPNARDLLKTTSNNRILSMVQMSMSSPWDSEFQNSVQMGLIPNLPRDGMELNGCMKTEL